MSTKFKIFHKLLLFLNYRITDRFVNYFYYKGNPPYFNPIYYWRLLYNKKCVSKLRENNELWSILNTVCHTSSSTGCDYSDYYELYCIIKKLRPRYILECGSGISTCVIALALKEIYEEHGKKGTCVSVEELPEYFNNLKAIIPLELKPFVELQCCCRKEMKYGSLWGASYMDIPDYPYNFVFIDGPSQRKYPGAHKCFNSDYINVLKKVDFTVYGLLDQRITTLRAFKKIIPSAEIRYSCIKKHTFISANRTCIDELYV